jgi:hypothetical protein
MPSSGVESTISPWSGSPACAIRSLEKQRHELTHAWSSSRRPLRRKPSAGTRAGWQASSSCFFPWPPSPGPRSDSSSISSLRDPAVSRGHAGLGLIGAMLVPLMILVEENELSFVGTCFVAIVLAGALLVRALPLRCGSGVGLQAGALQARQAAVFRSRRRASLPCGVPCDPRDRRDRDLSRSARSSSSTSPPSLAGAGALVPSRGRRPAPRRVFYQRISDQLDERDRRGSPAEPPAGNVTA